MPGSSAMHSLLQKSRILYGGWGWGVGSGSQALEGRESGWRGLSERDRESLLASPLPHSLKTSVAKSSLPPPTPHSPPPAHCYSCLPNPMVQYAIPLLLLFVAS